MKGNILNYLEEYGDVPLSEKPMNDVDSLVLCQLSYLKFDGLVPGVRENKPSVTLRNLKEHDHYEDLYADERYEKVNRSLFEHLLAGRRFRNMKLNCYINVVEDAWETQFSATTFILEDGTLFIAFRGTDESIIGWKEDFNMTYMSPVPGQEYSVKYLNMVTGKIHNPFYVGGHSKGGNLAMYGAMNVAPAVQERIKKIYCMDGPGFRPETLQKCGYDNVASRVVRFLPQASLVGMIFAPDNDYRVVLSHNTWLTQHDPFSWEVEGDRFVEVSDINAKTRKSDRNFNEWILALNEKQLKTFSDTFYRVMKESGIDDLVVFSENPKKSMKALLATMKELDPETREILMEIVMTLRNVIKSNK